MQSLDSSQNVILRSSDGALFYSWTTVLSISSPIFKNMFALPQPDTPHVHHDGLPIIDMAEDTRTLEHILSLCHPSSHSGKKFKIDSAQELGAVLKAATKYDMETLRDIALEDLTHPAFLREDPVRIYALACQYQRSEVMQLAAKHTLTLPTPFRHYVPEFEKIHAGHLCRLLLFREESITAARSLAEDHTWIVYTRSLAPLFGCDDNVGTTTVRHPPSKKYRQGRRETMLVHTWWLDYMRRSECVLQRSPHGDAVKAPSLMDDALTAISSSKCNSCEPLKVRETFLSFVDDFAKEVNCRAMQVKINFEF